MAVYNWSQLGTVTVFGVDQPSFNPFVDVLYFDDPSITAAFVYFDTSNPSLSIFSFGGKTVTLDTSPYTLTNQTPANITFANGSIFWYGDNTNTGPSPDEAGNTIVGGPGDDFLTGAGGDDHIQGGPGNDALAVTWHPALNVYGSDTLDGGLGREDFLVYIDRITGVTVTLGNETASGSAMGGDGSPGSTLTLKDIEGVFGTDFADTLNANSLTTVTGRVSTDIVQFFEGAGGNDTIVGASGGGRLTVLSYQFSPAGVQVSLETGPDLTDGWGMAFNDGWSGGQDTIRYIDGVIGSAFNDGLNTGSGFGDGSDEFFQFFEGMGGDDTLGGSRAAYDHSPFGVVVNLSETAITGDFYGAGAITVNSGTARDGWDSTGGGTDVIFGIDARGSKFNDTMIGDDEADNWFEGGGGDDYIDGRGEIDDHEDTVEYLNATGGVYVNLALGTAYGIGGADNGIGTDTLLNIEDVRGSDFDDWLIGGGAGVTSLYRAEGLQGRAGNDTLDGGDANPAYIKIASYELDPSGVIVNLSSSAVTVGSDVVAAGTARDGYGIGGAPAGIDTLIDINSVSGSRFGDYLIGSGGDNWFQPYAGNDTIDGGAGSDTAIFDGHDDLMAGVSVDLAAGTALDGGGNTDVLIGIENVWGTYRDDTITGSADDNEIEGMEGNDVIDGDAGTDTAIYRFEEDGISVDLVTGVASDGSGGMDTLTGIENIVGSEFDDFVRGGSSANRFEGDAGDDRLLGGGGADTLIGGAGSDTLDGGAGSDRMIGGTGDDTYIVDSTGDRVIEAAGAAYGNDTVITSASITLPLNVENIIFTGGASIVLTGNAQNNLIEGGSGDDTLNGGAGTDTVSYELADTPVVIDLESNIATGQGTDVLAGFENATGGSAADRLIGNSGNNVLDGNAGADTMTGGFGNDTYHVDRASDKVIESSNALPGALLLPDGDAGPGLAGVSGITDTVVAAITYSLNTGALSFVENLTLAGSASRGTGNALANKLTGNDRNNTLDGKDGNDVLNGGAGNDSLNGGAGTDRLNGGTGDDILIWASTDTHDGAAGTDTLKVLSGNLDLTTVLNSRIKNIEQIDLTNGSSNTLTLNASEVLAISSTTDTLTVLGNAGDTLSAVGFVQGADSGGFRTYTSGLATLLVDTDIVVT